MKYYRELQQWRLTVSDMGLQQFARLIYPRIANSLAESGRYSTAGIKFEEKLDF